MSQGRRRPSECIIQAVPNGCSKIIWVEHVEIPHLIIHSMSRSIISCVYAYGAKHWISFMKQQYARLACAMDITNYSYIEDLNKIGILDNVYGGVTTSSIAYNWTMVLANGIDDAVVDISFVPLLFRDLMAHGRRRALGCIIQALPNGDLIIRSMSRSIISYGYAYGAKHWVPFMKQKCECLACATDIANHRYIEELNKICIIDLSM
ncbi:hypothetical protein M9H77_19346 [Catharanthus roseus]|uniref:Uncharacterized protein n=1 Tax=Catharanthus roseus TaxID=4058 RepID=A0ACC0BA57_CATRO|nr:hypothetical protein M9H77_19346 [Catharanthus roseus]